MSRSHQYVLDGTNVIYEKQQTVAQFGGETNELYYHYDESGAAGFELNGTNYYFLKNIQGDVINILNSSGQVVVTYTYDAWGKVLSVTGSLASTVGQINPFRYRGYYYDTETGFYYLQTRYYDPEVGRFINADGYVSTGQGIIGNNMFAYCGNNPVNASDPNGDFFISVLAVCIIGGAAICGTAGGIIANEYAKSKGYTGADKARCIAVGIFGGGLFGGLLGYVAAPAVVSATGVAGISITSGIAVLGTSFGKLGTLIENDGQQIIDWSKTTCHGIQRMLERGVTQDMVEAWAKTGKALQQAGDKILYITKLGAVVIDKAGKVITAYTSQDFDPAMQKVIKKLFGK